MPKLPPKSQPGKATAAGPTAASPELAALRKRLGVGGGGTSAYDSEDPDAYFGDKYMKSSEVLTQFYVLPDAKLRKFQQDAVNAGLLDPKKVRWGAYDDDTYEVWRSAVKASVGFAANHKKVGPFKVLEQLAASTPAGAVGGGQAPASAAIANPLDVRETLKAAATSVLGSGLDEATIDRLTEAFQAEQARAQMSYQSAQQGGGTVENAPSLEAFAKNAVRNTDPVKADSRNVVRVASTIENMLAGSLPSQSAAGGI